MSISPAPKHPGPRVADVGFPTRLRMTLLKLTRSLRAQRSMSIPEGQHAVLATVVALGAMTRGELAEREHVRPPSMTRTVQCLVDAGLVERTTHPEDRRQVLITPTDAGTELVKETRRRRDQWLSKRLATLTPAERATLTEAEKILRRLYNQ
ncbi:MarR family winged helix-turn-helix transcriptional regulator [Sanguibacter sp. Z1732]|uniref:MarR family winged helix-turn-helix transcriptional regulator n=1 Tax=Sanguibacter sp. Z1732 TaxID=3435412 RepID=UPI003D9CA9B5